jgi:hypothetical protein
VKNLSLALIDLVVLPSLPFACPEPIYIFVSFQLEYGTWLPLVVLNRRLLFVHSQVASQLDQLGDFTFEK